MAWLTWDRFEAGLAEELPFMQNHDTVVLASGDYYVQLGQQVDSLLMEAVSNTFLPAARRLDHQAERTLAELGWDLPEPPPGWENWWCEVPWPMRSTVGQLVARRLRRTLQEVFGISEPSALTHRAWHYLSNEPLRWPVFVGLTGQPPPTSGGSERSPAVAGRTGDPRNWRPSDPDSQWWNPKPGDPYGPSDQPPRQPWEPEPPVRRFPR